MENMESSNSNSSFGYYMQNEIFQEHSREIMLQNMDAQQTTFNQNQEQQTFNQHLDSVINQGNLDAKQLAYTSQGQRQQVNFQGQQLCFQGQEQQVKVQDREQHISFNNKTLDNPQQTSFFGTLQGDHQQNMTIFNQNMDHNQTTTFKPGVPIYQDLSPCNSNGPDSMDRSSSYETINIDSPPDFQHSLQGSPVSMDFGLSSPRNSSSPSSVSSVSSSSSASGIQKKKGTPYIPSYMDLSNGPEPCVVCSDAATGYHYRCMTCEGCKGFFRRTIQKDLSYQCKWSGNCVIDKSTRNNCQDCRFKKCVAAGMAVELVLNERQRIAKRKLIEENREKRKSDNQKNQHKQSGEVMTSDDKVLVNIVVKAYEETSKTYNQDNLQVIQLDNRIPNAEMWQQLSEIITPSIIKVIEFAKQLPGFLQLLVDDQILLLKSCCMELMCLRIACRYSSHDEMLTLCSGKKISSTKLHLQEGLGVLTKPIFEFAVSLSKLQLDQTEIALLAAVLLIQSDRAGLKQPEQVEKLQDAILGAYKRYIAEKRPSQPVHWAKILMKVTDLRTISTRHADRLLSTKVDKPQELPPLFLDMFGESGSI